MVRRLQITVKKATWQSQLPSARDDRKLNYPGCACESGESLEFRV